MRKTFHQKLEEITEDVLAMGNLVQDGLHNSIEALIKIDLKLAEKVIEEDEKINEYDVSIEEKCTILQAEHQPVAIDLRFLHSVSIIIKNLERIGDLTVNIAKVIKRLQAVKEEKNLDRSIVNLLVEMGNLVKLELARALEAFKNRDAKLASRVDRTDDAVDRIQKMIFKKLFSSQKEKEDMRFITSIALASRYIERIGDQSVNIADRILYFLTGDYTVFHDNV